MPHSEPLHIGNRIKQELRQQDRSVAWLAGRAGLSRSTLTRMLRKHTLDSGVLYHVSLALGVDFHALYSQRMAGVAN